jgi:WD40 repeat protein
MQVLRQSLRDTATWENVLTLSGHRAELWDLQFSFDGRLLASCSSDGDRPVIVWEIPSGTLLKTYRDHRDWVTSVAFSPNTSFLATSAGGYDQRVRFWDLNSDKMVLSIPGNNGTRTLVRDSNSGKTLFLLGRFWSVNVWEVHGD